MVKTTLYINETLKDTCKSMGTQMDVFGSADIDYVIRNNCRASFYIEIGTAKDLMPY